MSRFSVQLERFLVRQDLTQAELAKLCGVAAPTIGHYLSGGIEVSRKNLAKILRGISAHDDQVHLLLAYLDDQIPQELRGAVSIVAAGEPMVSEAAATYADPFADALAGVHAATRESLEALVDRLKDDKDLCELVERTVAYIGDDEKRVFRRANRRFAGAPASQPRDSLDPATEYDRVLRFAKKAGKAQIPPAPKRPAPESAGA
jgi:transcriptional regulator with XRE-family HTH domain